jgi:hypothetical protein
MLMGPIPNQKNAMKPHTVKTASPTATPPGSEVEVEQ